MIFKRPYAFLIKYFKVINFILALLFIYIGYKSYNIMNFFNEYIIHNYSGNVYSNFYVEYISSIVLLAFFIVLILLAIILWLLIFKKKPIKIYVSSIIYYFILLIYFNIVKNIMLSMETTVVTAEVSRIYRDLSLIVLIPQLFFIISFVIRGLGLNIQKFNFEKDIKELEISKEDNEEVEITFKNDQVKLKRNIRRYFREFVYYVKENKIMVSIVGSILTIILIIMIINVIPKKVDANYHQGNTFSYNNLTYLIKDSIVTNLDYNGNIINKDKYYVVMVLNIKNNSSEDKVIDYNNFRLELDNSTIYPVLDKGIYFIDYAKEYSGTKIKGNSDLDYSLVFEIDKENIKNNYTVKFMSGSSIKKELIVGKYDNISISPSLINKISTISTSNLNEETLLVNSNIGNTKIKINNPEITNKYIYNYENCYNDKCNTYKDIINLDYTKNDKLLLVLDYDYYLDESIPYASTNKTVNGFVNYFVKVKYIIDGNEYYSDARSLTPSNLNNKIVLEVNKEIEKADNVYFSIIVRNKEYLIVIK